MKGLEAVRGLKPVYYIYGDEDYLVEEALKKISAGALTKGFESLNYHVFEGQTVDPEEAVTVARTVPAFSTMRLVVVKSADSLKTDREEEFMDYVKDPSPSTCFVFTAHSWKTAKASLLYKYLSKKGSVKACNRLSEGELARWIKNEAGKQGKKITDEAVQKLLAIAGGGLRDIKGELDKIVIFAGPKEVVDSGFVEGAGCEVREETAFDLADAIGRKDATAALKVFGKISGEEPLKVLGAITRQFRILLKLKTFLRKGMAKAKLPGLVGVSNKYFKGYLASCMRFTEEDLIGAFGKLKSADMELKSSRLPGKFIMSRLIIELCSDRKC
jgi:DNA polymerase-3 subunit delta